MKRNCRQKAFTIIELLVVIGVLALLMGIMLPVTEKVRDAAKRTICVSNLRNIGMVFRIYLDNNDDVMPPAAYMPSVPNDPNDPNSKSITEFLLPYLSQSKKVFKCPADVKYFAREGSSYAYNSRLGGRKVSENFMTERFNIKENNIEVMCDYASFHEKRGRIKVLSHHFRDANDEDGEEIEAGGVNYLYADWHVGDYRNQ